MTTNFVIKIANNVEMIILMPCPIIWNGCALARCGNILTLDAAAGVEITRFTWDVAVGLRIFFYSALLFAIRWFYVYGASISISKFENKHRYPDDGWYYISLVSFPSKSPLSPAPTPFHATSTTAAVVAAAVMTGTTVCTRFGGRLPPNYATKKAH